MGKEELQSRLVTELTNIGIPTEISTTSDIVINQSFTEEHNHGTITYQGKILFDSNSETLYFWEKIKKNHKGVSTYTGDFESSTQHYKVKSLGTNRNGHHQEITLDLSTIPVFIKSFAKSQNWAYKHVLIESKASYNHSTINMSSTKNSGCVLPILLLISGLVICVLSL